MILYLMDTSLVYPRNYNVFDFDMCQNRIRDASHAKKLKSNT